MLNNCNIQGRFTADPELRRVGSGAAVCSFTLACERDFADADGNRSTDFIQVVTWRNTAEFVAKYFTKGTMAVVRGRWQNREWTDKTGANRITSEILADAVYFCEKKAKTETAVPVDTSDHVDFSAITEDDNQLPF